MFSEYKTLYDSNNILFIVWVIGFQLLQNTCFNQALLIESFFVSENFKSNLGVGFVIVTMKNLSEGAFSNIFLDLETVRNVVFRFTNILTFFVVESAIFRAIRC